VKRGSRRFHRQSFYDGDTNSAEGFAVTEAESDMEGPLTNDCSERAQDDLRRVRYCIVTCQFANACSVNLRRRGQNVKIYRAVVAIRIQPSPFLPLSLGFTHRISPKL
jgi:hypothetical protein